LLARPERIRVSFSEEESGAAPIELPRSGAGLATLIVAAMFAVSLGVLVFVIRTMNWHAIRDVAGLVHLLFQLFWAIGWSLGVLLLGALTVLLSVSGFYRESINIAGGRLVVGPRFGPLHMLAEYDLSRIRNLRLEGAGEGAYVAFDYDQGSRRFGGSALPRPVAETILAKLKGAAPAGPATTPAPVAATAPRAEPMPQGQPAEPFSPLSALALLAANLVPLLGVLFAGWRLDQVIVLFWAESAIVAFYTLLKMAVVGRWLAIPAGLFFLAHFGAFMAIHFLFIYEMFVRGIGAHGHEPAAYEALVAVFAPLWPAVAALFLSHGVSFFVNFLRRSERQGMTLARLMAAPYQRVVLMQLTLIFGGFVVLALHRPLAALVILVGLKIATDLYAHRRERKRPLSLA
jgi:hypothetical protein